MWCTPQSSQASRMVMSMKSKSQISSGEDVFFSMQSKHCKNVTSETRNTFILFPWSSWTRSQQFQGCNDTQENQVESMNSHMKGNGKIECSHPCLMVAAKQHCIATPWAAHTHTHTHTHTRVTDTRHIRQFAGCNDMRPLCTPSEKVLCNTVASQRHFQLS